MIDLGNFNAREGIDRCECGCKYWENDKCIDCGQLVEIIQNRVEAQRHKFLFENYLNMALTTWVHYSGIQGGHGLTVEGTNEKYRAMGVIR